MKDWHYRFRAMKKDLGLVNEDIAKITGSATTSVNTVTQPNKELPRWLKFAIVVHERWKNVN